MQYCKTYHAMLDRVIRHLTAIAALLTHWSKNENADILQIENCRAILCWRKWSHFEISLKFFTKVPIIVTICSDYGLIIGMIVCFMFLMAVRRVLVVRPIFVRPTRTYDYAYDYDNDNDYDIKGEVESPKYVRKWFDRPNLSAPREQAEQWLVRRGLRPAPTSRLKIRRVFSHYWPFVRGIRRLLPVVSLTNSQ